MTIRKMKVYHHRVTQMLLLDHQLLRFQVRGLERKQVNMNRPPEGKRSVKADKCDVTYIHKGEKE